MSCRHRSRRRSWVSRLACLAITRVCSRRSGGASTLVASYLARCRGSGEPELSGGRAKDLEHFLRDCRAFQMDHGHESGQDDRIDDLRRRFEQLLGNDSSQSTSRPERSHPSGPDVSKPANPIGYVYDRCVLVVVLTGWVFRDKRSAPLPHPPV